MSTAGPPFKARTGEGVPVKARSGNANMKMCRKNLSRFGHGDPPIPEFVTIQVPLALTALVAEPRRGTWSGSHALYDGSVSRA